VAERVSARPPAAVLGRAVLWRAGLLVLRRAGLLLVLLAAVFLLVDLLPGDAARSTLDANASAGEVAARRARLGLDRPWFERFAHWLGGLCTGDLGVSARGRPVWEVVGPHLPNTLLLGGIVLALTAVAALGLGGLAVLRPGGRLDRAIDSGATVLLALPEFVLGTGLVVVFAFYSDLLPAVTTTSTGGGVHDAGMLVLPALALALPQIGWNTRIVRTALTEQLRAPHVDAAVLDGLPRRRVLLHHLLPGAVPPIATGLATSAGLVLGGAVTVETLFNYPGLGSVLTDALQNRDGPTVAGVVALAGLIITSTLVPADLLGRWARRFA